MVKFFLEFYFKSEDNFISLNLMLLTFFFPLRFFYFIFYGQLYNSYSIHVADPIRLGFLGFCF